MSTPAGPGWQQGPDGRWYPPAGGPPPQYPPQPHPSQPYPPQPYGPPPPWAQRPPAGPPPAPPGPSGRTIAIVVGVVVAVAVLAGVAVNQFVSGVVDRAGGLGDGFGSGCEAVDGADVDAALGGHYDVVQLGGAGAIAAPVLDSRVLADAPACWAVESGSADSGGRLARIARYSGPDAAQRFADERRTAMGTTEDRGGGISVSTSAYFNKDVEAGDEAFCTTGDFAGSAGVLVRRGDLLVSVSTTAAGDGAAAIPQIEFDPGATDDTIHFATDDANCELAVALAAAVR